MFVLHRISALFAMLGRTLTNLSGWTARQARKSRLEALISLGVILQVVGAALAVTFFVLSGALIYSTGPALIGIFMYGLYIASALVMLKLVNERRRKAAGWVFAVEFVAIIIGLTLFASQLSGTWAFLFLCFGAVVVWWKIPVGMLLGWGLWKKTKRHQQPTTPPVTSSNWTVD